MLVPCFEIMNFKMVAAPAIKPSKGFFSAWVPVGWESHTHEAWSATHTKTSINCLPGYFCLDVPQGSYPTQHVQTQLHIYAPSTPRSPPPLVLKPCSVAFQVRSQVSFLPPCFLSLGSQFQGGLVFSPHLHYICLGFRHPGSPVDNSPPSSSQLVSCLQSACLCKSVVHTRRRRIIL